MRRIDLGSAVLLLLGAGFLPLAGCGERAGEEATEVFARRVSIGSEFGDPEASFWKKVPEFRIPMLPQNVAEPTSLTPAVSQLRVRAAHDGGMFAVRIEWSDNTQSIETTVDRFGDQVAVEFPLPNAGTSQPSPMMGHPGAPVRILQWRGVLQWEVTHGPPTIQDLYPNAVVDLYPDQVLTGEVAAPYGGGRAIGNPVAKPRLLSPVLTHVAEGFGSLTIAPDQQAGGAGVWDRDRWRVTITHPFPANGDSSSWLRPGIETLVGFAVWEGGSREVGSRKAWSSWVKLRVEP